MIFNLSTLQRFPFASCPTSCDLPEDKICVSDMLAPDDYNPHNRKAWIVGDVSGALALVWADCEGDAWDEAADAGALNHLQLEEDEASVKGRDGDWMDNPDLEIIRAGNASEPFHVDGAWMVGVSPGKLETVVGRKAWVNMLRAQAQGCDSLDELR